jgi:hypothetical protein
MITKAIIEDLEYQVAEHRKLLRLTWDRRWCGPGWVAYRLRILADLTAELFDAYGEFERGERMHLFGRLN